MQDLDLTASGIVLNPLAAQQLLKRPSPRQRKVSQANVTQMVLRMNADAWPHFHPQPISLDEHMRLLDGMHRCLAHIQADFTSEYPLTTGLPEDAFAWFDVGHVRRAAQFVTTPNASKAMTVVSWLMVLELTEDTLDNLQTARRLVNARGAMDTRLDYLEQHPAVNIATHLAEQCYRACRIRGGQHGALLTRALEAGLDREVKEWSEALISGALQRGDPRLALRDRWLRDSQYLNSVGDVATVSAWNLLVRGWNNWMAGEHITKAVAVTGNLPMQRLSTRYGWEQSWADGA